MRLPLRASVLLLFVHLMLATTASGQKQHRPSSSPRHRPNVLLITIDTLRADYLGCYGARGIATPIMDALARDGLLFERAITQVPLTLPAHAAILTGTYPFSNGVQDFTGQPLRSEFRTIAQSLQKAGYATAAVVSSFVLDRSWGLARGFDHYNDRFPAESFLEQNIALVERKANASVDSALEWLRKNSRRRFFLWLHLYDPHSPYIPPEPFRSRHEARPYAGEVEYTDSQLSRVIGWLKKNGLYSSTLILLVGDHGESLGEHGESEHGFFVYNSTVHVPLMLKPPISSRLRPRRVSRPVETTAIASTILDIVAVRDSIEKQFQSRELLHKLRNSEVPASAYSESFYSFSSFGWSPLRSLQTDRYHYIDSTRPELYDLEKDPEEKKDVSSSHPAVLAVLKERLKQLVDANLAAAAPSAASNLSAETVEKLRALGYVAYRSPVSPEALAAGLPDPKDKLWEFNTILRATDAARQKDYAGSRSLLEAVRAREPNLYLIPFMLGEAALEQENWAEAERELKKALELNANFDQAMTALARALHAQGSSEAAKDSLRRALALNPLNIRAWYQLGWMQLRENPEEAAQMFDKVISIQPDFPLARRDLGLIRFRQERYKEAAEHLARANELGLKDPRLLNFLGIAYSRTGRYHIAVTTYRRALKADPDLAEAHLNLGFAYEQLKQTKLARQEYEAACRLKEEFCRLVRVR